MDWLGGKQSLITGGQRSAGLRSATAAIVGVAESPVLGFLKRLFGGAGSGSDDPTTSDAADPVDIDAAERARDLELARGEQDRLDELSQRQLRYAAMPGNRRSRAVTARRRRRQESGSQLTCQGGLVLALELRPVPSRLLSVRLVLLVWIWPRMSRQGHGSGSLTGIDGRRLRAYGVAQPRRGSDGARLRDAGQAHPLTVTQATDATIALVGGLVECAIHVRCAEASHCVRLSSWSGSRSPSRAADAGSARTLGVPRDRVRTGAFFDGTATQTVTVNADTSNLGTFSISDGTSRRTVT
jgi:hypothetical protein